MHQPWASLLVNGEDVIDGCADRPTCRKAASVASFKVKPSGAPTRTSRSGSPGSSTWKR